MAEYYRQFAFVSFVLTGFAFTFYATLLSIDRQKSAVSWAAARRAGIADDLRR